MATKKTINVNGVLTEVWETAASAQQIDDAALGNLAATSDCNTDLKAGGNRILFSRYDTNSLNSPYKEGLVSDSSGMIITYAFTSNYGRQFCFCAGLGGFIGRYMRNGVIEKWVKLADTNYAVNKAGDTMTGDLYMGGGYSRFTSTANQLQVEVRKIIGSTNNRRLLNLYNENTRDFSQALGISEIDSTGKTANAAYFLHTGNKPSGSYTGNGSAAARTIATGGIGTTIVIYSEENGSSIIARKGVINRVNSDITALSGSAATFGAEGTGILRLSTDSKTVNQSGVTYYYQVL